MSKHIVIIGAGIGGLATANLLAKDGYSVTVIEKNDQLGGRAGRKTTEGFTFDTGPSWYLMPGVFDTYFSQFNRDVATALDIKRLEPAYKVFFQNGTPLTIHGDLRKDSATFEAIEQGAGKALVKYVEEGEEIYRLALDHFLYTDFSRPSSLLKRSIITKGGQLTSLLTTPLHKRVSTFVRHPHLQQILEYPMVFLGTSPFTAPGMYSLMSALDFKEGVFYPKRGMYSIIELLVEIGKELGVEYRLEKEVAGIQHADGRATGVQLKDGAVLNADVIISNADLHYTETALLDTQAQSYPESFWRKKEAGISALLMYIGVKGELPQLEHHNLYFVEDWQANFEAIYKNKTIPKHASMYVSRTSATDPTTAPKDHENLFVLVPLPTGITLDQTALEKTASYFLEQLATAIDTPDLQERVVVRELFGPDQFSEKFHAWQGTALGMSHVLRQSALWRIPPVSKKLDNLYYVGANTLPGIGLPMCLISAEIVHQKIVEREAR